MICFTICSLNYIPQARVWAASLLKHHSEATVYVFLCDAIPEVGCPPIGGARIISLTELGIEHLEQMAFLYSVIELNTAIKPFCFDYLFKNQPDAADIVYFDPDILILSPMVELEQAFVDGHELILTPHMEAPLEDGARPDDLTIMKSGINNLGFCGLKKSVDTTALVQWWMRRLTAHCRVDIANHLFTDQRWMDLAPSFVEKTFLLRQPGYNIAYWNLIHRPITRSPDGQFTTKGHPLRFFHFSGINSKTPHIFSKHQDRFLPVGLNDGLALHKAYIQALNDASFKDGTVFQYGFGTFANGREIFVGHREYYKHFGYLLDEAVDPFRDLSGWFDEPEDRFINSDDARLTRLAIGVYFTRSDLQGSFDLETAYGRASYSEWFTRHAAEENSIDTLSQKAQLNLQASSGGEYVLLGSALRQSLSPERSIGTGLSNWLTLGDDYLIRPAEFDSPPISALMLQLWRARQDLQQSYADPLGIDRKPFFKWCLTNGIMEECLPASGLAVEIYDYMGQIIIPAQESKAPILRGHALFHSLDGNWSTPGHDLREYSASAFNSLCLSYISIAYELGWHRASFDMLEQFLSSPSQAFGSTGMSLPVVLETIWRIRPDLQEQFPMGDHANKYGQTGWFLLHGLSEFSLEPTIVAHWFKEALNQPTIPNQPLSNLELSIAMFMPTIISELNLASTEHIKRLHQWFSENIDQLLPGNILTHILPDQTKPEETANVSIKDDTSLCLAGEFSVNSGRGEDARLAAKALKQAGASVLCFDVNDGKFRHNNKLVKPTATQLASIDTVISFSNADNAVLVNTLLRNAGITGARLIGFWVWELESFPDVWQASFDYFDEIWAPTRFVYQAFKTSAPQGMPVRLMPFGVEATRRTSKKINRQALAIGSSDTVFLYSFNARSFVDRKNPLAAVEAFSMAFPQGTEPVWLILKVQNGELDQHTHYQMQQIHNLAHQDARIILLDKDLSRNDYMALLTLCDCYVSPHRSEGFGRGPAEALLLGKQVIAADYSGTTDFLTSENSLLCRYNLIELEDLQYPATGAGDAVWADIDIGGIAEHMRTVAGTQTASRKQTKSPAVTFGTLQEIGETYLAAIRSGAP